MSTPMQLQYNKLKKKYEDCILLFRLGDFYECFDNDAKIISKVLGIVLTKRGKNENSIPMAGIPFHALDSYLPKIVKAGYKVAVAEQLEEPQAGKIVKRDVIKIVTAGTLTSEKYLSDDKNIYIGTLISLKDKKNLIYGLAVCDITTGEFFIQEFYNEEENLLISEIKKLQISELVTQESLITKFQKSLENIVIEKNKIYSQDFDQNNKLLCERFKVENLKGFGVEKYKAGIISAGVLISYLSDTQKVDLVQINKIYYKSSFGKMLIDENTIRNLEILDGSNPSSRSLRQVIDRCNTSMGKRKLIQWMINPLIDSDEIKYRLSGVEKLVQEKESSENIREYLDNINDIERIAGKLGSNTVMPKDLIALSISITNLINISDIIDKFDCEIINNVKLNKNIEQLISVKNFIESAIFSECKNTITEGGIIKKGFNSELDNLLDLSQNGRDWIQKFQTNERNKTGIINLKVKYNKVFGYFIEVSKGNLSKVPDYFIRKQTLVNAERFITEELKEKEEQLLNAYENSIKLEYEIFCEIREKLKNEIPLLQEISEKIAILDCLGSFAYISIEKNYVKPEIIAEKENILEIVEGRHPVIEEFIKEEFIPNDTFLNPNNLIAIITGPNMAGKSTYIRQTSLIVYLAQIGCFVPAKSVKLSPVDRIFTRIGASDNLSKGESTFLVEMNETANILNNATDRSLIILDEVGRGTSTYDGVAIAWSVVYYIHEKIKAKTLFATHYHELIDLEKILKNVFNLNIQVQEYKGKVVFLRKIIKGGTDKSYGIHVANLAGIPEEVTKKAEEILLTLKQENMFEVKHIESEVNNKNINTQISLPVDLPESKIIKELKKLNLNKITPIEALNILSKLKSETN